MINYYAENKMKKTEEKLKKKIKQALYDFKMIQDWDLILLWVSWGKDSMFLWYFLNEIRKNFKYKFDIRWIYISRDFLVDCDIWFEEKRKYFEETLNIPLEKFDLKLPKESKLNSWVWVSCQRCAYARRITLMKLAEKYKATKIAFWHHMDDIVVTTMMNIITWRNIKIMPPLNKMSRGNITFIRPLSYVREKEIENFVNKKNIPFSTCICPIWENKTRNKVKKEIIWENEKLFPNYVENLFWAFLKDFEEKYKNCNYSM